MFKKLEILLGFILVVIAGLFISCNVNPFFGVGTEVDLEEPRLAVTSHISGDFVNSSFTISGTCRDNKGVVKVQIQLNGTNPLVSWDATIEGNTIEGGTWVRDLVFPIDDITGTREGDKLLDIFAYDERGNRTQTRVYLTVDDDSPTVTITDPILKTPEFFNQLIASDASSDFINLEYFSNGILQIKGYADDTFIINSTRLDIYDSEDLTVPVSDENLPTPVKTVTIEKNRALPAEAGENSFPSKFTFNIDTTGFTNNRAYLVSVSTEDMAGNKNSQTSIGYFYLDQDKDRPNGKISSPSGSPAITFPQSTASGTIWDDDGLSGYYWYLGNVDTNTANFESWKSPKGYNDEGSLIVVTDEVAWGYVDLSSDVPPKILSWQMVTANKKGTFYMYIVPVDINGLTPVTPISKMFVQKTSDAPTLSIISPDSRTTQRGEINVALNATGGEDKKVTLLSYRIEGIVKYPSDLSSDYRKINVIGDTDSNGNLNGYVIPIDSLLYVNDVSHDIKLSVYCTNDNSEDSRILDFYLRADNDGPKVKIDNPVANSGLNGKVTVSGTAQDDYSGVKTLYFGYFDNGVMKDASLDKSDNTYDFINLNSDTALSNITLASHNKWHKVVFSQAAWSYEFDTTKLPDGNNRFYVAAADAMGNVGYTSEIYLIDQELDKPGARILSPTAGSSTFPRSVASGDATDDDGLGYIYWFIGKTSINFGGGAGEPTSDYTLWGDVSTDTAKSGRIDLSATAPTVSAWKIDQTPGGTGEFTIHIVPVDKFGTAGIKRTLTYTQNTSSAPQVQIVSPNPSINNKGDIVVSVKATAGGEFKVAAIKYDLSSDIKSDFDEVTIPDPGTWGAVVDYSLPAFDSTLFTNNTVHDIIVDVWCVNSNGDESQKTRTYLKADNVAPASSITNPAEGEGMNGIWPVYGSISDDWSGVDALYFSYYTGAEPASSTYDTLAKIEAKASENLSEVDGTTKIWHKVDFTQAAWSYNFDTEKITSGAKSYKLIVASVDNVGNVGWVSRTYNIDQELDYPHSKIMIPLANGNTFPQSVVSAEASDDDGVAKVFWRIKLGDPEAIGDPDLTTGWGTSDPTNDMSGIIDVDGSPRSYPFQLNTPKGDGKFTIYTRTYDVNGKLQKVATTRTYYQYASNDPHIQVKSPTNLSQTFTGAMKVVVRASGGANYNVNSLKYRITSDKPFDSGLKDATITVGNIADATIDIDTAAYTSASVHDIKVEIYCVNEKGVSSSVAVLNLKADNTAPTTLSISGPNAGSGLNGLAVISGAVQDDWSGIDALYFGYFASMTDATMNSTYNTKAKLDAAVADKTLGKWSRVINPTAAWSYSFDTTKITSTQANPYNLYVAAVDKVGNVGYTSRSFFIDQDLDKPTASILVPVANGVTVFPESTATGGAIDDDGLARIYIFIGKTSVYNDTNLPADKNTWGTYSDATACGYVIDLPTHPTNYSWSVKTPGGAGTYKMWVLPVDINSPATEGTYETRTFNQATSSTPSISVLTNPSTTYMGDLTIDVQATGGGAKTVKSIGYRIFSTKLGPTLGTLTGVSSSPGAGQFLIATSVSTSFKFDTSLYTSDTVVDVRVDVWVTNEDDVTSQESTVYYRADNTKPVVTITSPGAGTTINGNQYISGTANDWSQVEALYFGYFTSANPPDMLSYYTTKSRLDADSILSTSDPTTDKWHKVESPSINWTYAFRTEDVTKDIDAGFKLYVVAVDKVGNVNYVVRAYTIDQDMDKPMITITNPGYSGAEPAVVRNDGEMAFIPRTYVMMGTVQDGDQDGIRNVHIDIDILANNGDHSADVYPPNASGDTGDGYNNVSSVEPMILGDALTSWTYKISNYALSLPGEFYRVRVRPIDAHGKLGLVRSSYFVVTNVAPEVEIISPSILDPDTPEATNPDVYGTVISNVKDDIYWDADPNNNLIYYDDDSNRRNWGWNTDLFEESFNIFNNTVPGSADATRSNYYRMIFRAKDNGRINTVEISVDGGANTAAELSWSGGITSADGHFNQTIHDSAKIKAVDVMKRKVLKGNYFDYTYENMDTTNDATSDWVYFFVDIDTTKLSPSAMFKVTVGDNNDPSSYETTASVQVNVDNSAPTGSILNWGIDSLTEKHEFSKTGSAYQYIAGDLSDFGSAGVRYANLYFWNNMETDLDAMPNYKENGSGLITVNDPTNVPSGVHKVSIPENLGSVLVKNGVGDIGDVNPASSVSDNYPNSWIRAYKYLSSGWRVRYIYTNDESPSDADGNPGTYYGISTKYGDVYPSDGKKLICLEVVDNAGNKARKFYEHTFSEYPPTVTDANISWGSLPEEPVTDETPAGRKWISNSFSMNGVVRDYVAGTNPTPGIERVRVYIMKDDNGDGIPESTQRIYTSKTSEHDVPDSMHNNKKPVKVINTAPDISEDPTGDANPVTWGFISAQSINLLDGNYMIMVEVRDKTGSTARKRQYVYLDKSAPTLVVNQPTNNQVVKGDLFVISGTASDAAGGGFNAGCVNIKILDATSDALKREWNTSLDSSNNWTQDWSLISDASDDFDISESRKVRVTLTDKAGNTHTLPDITVTKGPPPSWDVFEANGSSTSFNNATFKSKYTTIGASDPLFMIRGATSTFETQIQDSIEFTGAELKVAGYRQSDGAYLSSATPGFETLLATKTLNPNTGGVVGGNVTYTYAGLPDGEYEYKVELHQEAALINMRRYFIVDNTKPNIWVKKIENTDYVLDGAAKLGHVDRNEDFSAAGYTTGTDAETGIVGADMVSGVIRFHIKAKDNYRLKRIRAKMTDLAFIGALGGGYYTLAYRDNTDNWTVAAQRGSITSGVATRDYMKVTNVTGSVIGHNYDYVYLIVEFNTAQLTNVAGLNKHLEIVAEDWVGNLTDYTGGARPKNTGTISDSLFYGAGTEIITKDSNLSDDNAKAVKFVLDVVPYITEIETADRLNGGLKSNNIRSASGKYSIIQGSSGSFITVRGYNLNPITNGTRIVSSASSYKNGLNGTALQGVYIAFTGSGSPYTSLTLTNNSSNSGYLAIVSGTVANPVGSINNVNSNSVETNKEADHYITRNPTLTDDRYLRFFSTKQTPTRNGYYPNMIMDSDDNPVFGYVDMSGGTAASGAGNYFPSHAMPQRTKYNLSDGTKNDTTEYLVKASIWEQMGMAKDDGGRYYHATLYNRDGCGFALIYDRFAELHDTTNMVGWGAGTTYSNITSYPQRSAVQDTGNNAIALETTSYSSLLLDRYKYPKLIAKGNSATNYATLYMLYFDDNTTNKDLIFRNLQIGTNAGNRTTALHSGYGRYTNFTENTGNSDSWESGRLTAASGASQYFDMAVTSGNIVVVVYYDETAGRLKMRYSDAAVTGANPTTAITWNNSPVVFPNYVGNYVSMAIDAGNGIHIAAFNATDADLTYIYVPNHTVNSKAVATVDAYGSIGQWTQIKMRGNVPHIAYYNSTETGTRESIKYAYANFNVTAVGDVLPGVDAGNYTTGNWEYMTIPALTPPQGGIPKFKQVNLDFHSSGRPVFGYLGTFIEFSMPVAE